MGYSARWAVGRFGAVALNVYAIEEIPPEPPTADQRRFRVEVDDGTIPGKVKVWLTKAAHAALVADIDDWPSWVRDRIRAAVEDVPDFDQLAELRRRAPLELNYPD